MDNGYNTKHVWLPQGDTPGKPEVKIRRETNTCETPSVSATRPSRRSLAFTVEKEGTVTPNPQRPKSSWPEK